MVAIMPVFVPGCRAGRWYHWPRMSRTSPLIPDLPSLVPPLLDVCSRAGALICRHYHAPGDAGVRAKRDDSPLTQADLDSHHLLLRELYSLTPDIPVLSEESGSEDKSRRRDWSELWLVDPLDGTREFVERTGEFTINVALLSAHRPVLGVLYLPLEEVAWVGIPGQLSRRYALRDGAWESEATSVRPLEQDTGLTLLASRRHRGERLQRCLDWLEHNWGPCDRLNSGSAVKFCHLADGLGDFYPRFSPCCEWDTGAGQAVLEAAGGCLLGLDGEPLRYNTGESLLSPDFYAIADGANELWARLIQRDGP